ncbi:hypothetical protein M3Y97_00653700 [Aphelenchoides bicaudatus]|nr:hypothetical protein M3Y97_00653700 [Aphelenchoides bicaudatus]
MSKRLFIALLALLIGVNGEDSVSVVGTLFCGSTCYSNGARIVLYDPDFFTDNQMAETTSDPTTGYFQVQGHESDWFLEIEPILKMRVF